MSASTLPGSRSGLCRAAVIAIAVVLLLGSTPVVGASAPVVTAGPRSSGAVAVTFDDGWDRGTCRRVAQALRAHGIKGTFFINGRNLVRRPDRWRRILAGMPVANHTMTHVDLVTRSNASIRWELTRNEAVHERILGRPMVKMFRPPYMSSNARVRSIAASLGYRRTVLWNVDTRDWEASATTSSIVARAIGAPRGSII